MKRNLVLLAIPASLLATVAVAAGGKPWSKTFTETFKPKGHAVTNEGNWAFGGPGDHAVIEKGHGAPRGWFATSGLDTFAPMPGTEPGLASEFTGDYRARGVTRIGIDLRLDSLSTTWQGRPLALLLTHDNGTPGDFMDDCTVFLLGSENIPEPGTGWKSFAFDVPSESATLPLPHYVNPLDAGWGVLYDWCDGVTGPDDVWNRVITDVDQVTFHYGDPTMFFIFQLWDTSLDNVSITTETD